MTLENIYGILLGAGILLAVFVFALIKRRYDRQPEPEPIPVRNEPQRLTKHPAFGRPMDKPIPRPTLVAPPARNSGARTTYAQRSDDKDYEVISPYDPRSPLYHVMTAPQDNPATTSHSSTFTDCAPSSSSSDSGSSSSYDSGSSSSCDSGSSSSGGSD